MMDLVLYFGGILLMLGVSKPGASAWWGVSILVMLSLLGVLMSGVVYGSMRLLGGLMLCDELGLSLSLLSCWLVVLVMGASFYLLRGSDFVVEFMGVLVFLGVVLILSFAMGDLLSFYFFFESSLIPTLIIIFGWGAQPERLQAGLYFLFYTLVASLPLLLGIIWLREMEGSLSYYFNWGAKASMSGGLWFLVMNLAFLVSAPMFLVHVWLPKAHVEAPVSGSMVLAGILLKLGGYGMYRIMGVLSKAYLSVGGWVYGLSLVGMVVVGVVCCRVADLKSLVAYSSVAHMGLVIMGVLGMYVWGVMGSLIMMVAHGLTSSGMFYLVNLMYGRSGSRSIFMNSGVIASVPVLSFLVFLILISNFSAPPTLNLLGEVFLIIGVLKFSVSGVGALALGCFLGAVFTLHMYSYTQHGEGARLTKGLMLIQGGDLSVLVQHIIPINVLFMAYGAYFM